MAAWLDTLRQCFWIAKPAFTEQNLSDQTGRVFIVTGGYAGVGKELSKFLYQKNGTVYLAGRSKGKGDAAIEEIRKSVSSSDGHLEFLQLDLADLSTIKGSVEDFMRREQRLDVLTNNAGVMAPPVGSKSAQGYELQMGTNVLGPWLFTELLTPLIQKTAKSSPPGSVRVTWAASLVTVVAPKDGVLFEGDAPKAFNDRRADYAQSKAANVLLARTYQAKYGKDGITSNAWNPGNLRSELQRYQQGLEKWVTALLVYPPVLGAYTELFAGWSDEPAKPENKDKYIGPWGQFVTLRKDLQDTPQEQVLWEWCENECRQYM